MRRAGLVVATALVAALAPFGAHAAVGCNDPCTVTAQSTQGYVSPAIDIPSASTVQWVGLEAIGHPTGDLGAEPCFFVNVSSSDVARVTFTIANGVLKAKTGTTTKPCGGALQLPDGSFVLPYQCHIHPNMRGVIRVES
ncbi:MAG: hypothetical protein ABR552_08565 [Actinomycetota bacterium]